MAFQVVDTVLVSFAAYSTPGNITHCQSSLICVLFVSLLSKLAKHFVQLKIWLEMSASDVDAVDAVAVAVAPLADINRTNNWY